MFGAWCIKSPLDGDFNQNEISLLRSVYLHTFAVSGGTRQIVEIRVAI